MYNRGGWPEDLFRLSVTDDYTMSGRSPQDVLKDHLGPDESIREFEVAGSYIYVVTDQRLIELKSFEYEDGRPAENVRAILLNSSQVLATTVNERGRPNPNYNLVAGGVLSCLFGLFAGFAGLSTSGTEQGLALLVGLVLLVIGLITLYRAFDRPEGSIRVTITSAGSRETIFMPRNARNVAGEVSSVVSEGH